MTRLVDMADAVIGTVFEHPLATGVVCVGIVLTSCVVLAIALENNLEFDLGEDDEL